MGINKANLDEQHIVLKNPQTQAAATLLDQAFVEFDGVIDNIHAELGTAGITGNQIVDVNKNGTTIFGSTPKITFAAAAAPSAYDSLAAGARNVSKGDKLSIDVDSIHTGTAGEDLLVHIVIRKKTPGNAPTNLAPANLPN